MMTDALIISGAFLWVMAIAAVGLSIGYGLAWCIDRTVRAMRRHRR